MKYFFWPFLIIVIWYPNAVAAQENDSIQVIRYLKAYEYIRQDSLNVNKNIYVTDTIIDPDWHLFSDELINYPLKKEWVNNYRQSKGFHYANNESSVLLDSLFNKTRKNAVETILIFSNMIEDMLIAELLPAKESHPIKIQLKDPVTGDSHIIKRKPLNVNWLRSFTESYIYLFMFDENEIKDVFKIEMIYD